MSANLATIQHAGDHGTSGTVRLIDGADHDAWHRRTQTGRFRVVSSTLDTTTGVVTIRWESKRPGEA